MLFRGVIVVVLLAIAAWVFYRMIYRYLKRDGK